MNKVFLLGNLVHDPELKSTSTGQSVTTFKIAVRRGYKDKNGEDITDFFSCVAWRDVAENIAKFFQKGRRILVEGSIHERSYDGKDGKKVYVTEINVSQFHFVDSAKSNSSKQNQGATFQTPPAPAQRQQRDYFDPPTDVQYDDGDLPF